MDNIARINGKDLRISTKQCVEICSFIREKKVAKAKYALERVLKKKMAVPFKRYNRDIGHKHGIASGSYPINASSEILRLLIELEANAENKGLSKNELYISKIMANREVKGTKIQIGGRLDGSEIARSEHLEEGNLPLQTLRADIDYAKATAHTTYGTIGVKVWIYKGEKFEDKK